MAYFTGILIRAALLMAATLPAMAQIAAPDTAPECAPLTSTIYFAADQAELSSAAMAALEAQAAIKKGCVISTIQTTATSTDGDSNLSELRSAAVVSALSSLGIASPETKTLIGNKPDGRLIATARQVDILVTTRPAFKSS